MPDILRVDVLNGPNTNLYGQDPAGPHGRLTLADIEALCLGRSTQWGACLRFRQTKSEGTLIDWIHDARTEADGLVINGGSLSYISIGVMDALASFKGPSFQVDVSNVFKREPIRHDPSSRMLLRDVSSGLELLATSSQSKRSCVS